MEYALLVAIIILFAVVLFILLLPTSYYGEYDGKVVEIDTSECLTQPDFSCFGANPQSPYEVPFFFPRNARILYRPRTQGELESLLLQVRSIAPNEAVAVYGAIPRGYLYWSVTGYVYDVQNPETKERVIVFASVADSVSSGREAFAPPVTGFGAVLTSNPRVFEEVKQNLREQWARDHPGEQIVVLPMYIPSYMYNERLYRYATLVRTTLRQMSDPRPVYHSRFYRYANLPAVQVPEVFYIPRSLEPREQDIMSQDLWVDETRQLIASKYQIIRELGTQNFLAGLIPGGLNYGWQCLFHDDGSPREVLINGRGDNRDSTYILSEAINLTRRQTSVAVVAVNHARTGRASYSSITFYLIEKEYGYSTALTGEAPTKIDRDSLEVKIIVNNPDDSFFGDLDAIPIAATERAYVEPTSGVGPAPSSILFFRAFLIEYAPTTIETLVLPSPVTLKRC